MKRKLRDNAFVYVDEGQTLNQQGKRQGNIVLPTIRSAFSGETSGRPTLARRPPARPAVATARNGDELPERERAGVDGRRRAGYAATIHHVLATDPTVPLEPPEHPGYYLDVEAHQAQARSVPPGKSTTNCGSKTTPRSPANEEDDDELDSHEPLMLSKLSALLCLIDWSHRGDPDDLALAKIMYATSRAVMDDLVEYGREKQQDKADAYAEAHATREARGYLAKKNADSNVSGSPYWSTGTPRTVPWRQWAHTGKLWPDETSHCSTTPWTTPRLWGG